MNRRRALALLASVPMAARLRAQTRPTARHRIVLATGVGFLIEPDGTVKGWVNAPGAREEEPAPDTLGLGHDRPVYNHTLYPVPGLANVVAAAAGTASFAVLDDGRLLTWGTNAHYETGRSRSASVLGPGPVKELVDVRSLAACTSQTIAVLGSGRMMTWGEVREWTRPDTGGGGLSPFPILLWLDGLDQP